MATARKTTGTTATRGSQATYNPRQMQQSINQLSKGIDGLRRAVGMGTGTGQPKNRSQQQQHARAGAAGAGTV